MSKRPTEGQMYILDNKKLILITNTLPGFMNIKWIGNAIDLKTEKEIHIDGLNSHLSLVPNMGETYLLNNKTVIKVDEVTISIESGEWQGSATIIDTEESISINSGNSVITEIY